MTRRGAFNGTALAGGTLAAAALLSGSLTQSRADDEPADAARALMSTPVTQLDIGLDRLQQALLPVFLEVHADGSVIWNPKTSRIVVWLAMDRTEGEANWDPARRAAAAIRRRLGVDPDHRRVADGQERRLEELFQLIAAPSPPAGELARLIRIVVAVPPAPNVSPYFYSADLLGGDVQLDIDPDR